MILPKDKTGRLIFRLLLIIIPSILTSYVIAQRQTKNTNEGKQTVTYSLHYNPMSNPRLLDMDMRFSVPAGKSRVIVQVPVWSPGDYHIQNHAKYLTNISASYTSEDGTRKELKVTHPDENSWQIEPDGASQIDFRYSLQTTPPGIFSENVKLDTHQAFLNGAAAFPYLADHKDWKATLEVFTPQGWTVETPLKVEMQKTNLISITTFNSPDYDTLADSPIILGDSDGLAVREFTVNKVPHKVLFFGRKELITDYDAYTPVLQKLAQAVTDIMGMTPYQRYDFFFDVGGEGGGLEHLNSCRIALFPRVAPTRMASMFSHEFFHLWNVKRIRPAVLGPFDYVHPPKTHNLWFAEGVTEYYAHVAIRRAELTSPDEFYSHWRRAISSMSRNPAHKRITAEDASFRVWESGNSEGFGGLSYYDKGELIGLCLDLKIRNETHNKKSLDDVMRLLLQRHNPPKPGYGEDEIRSVVSEVAETDLTEFYNLLARSTEELPTTECLSYAGLDENARPVQTATEEQIALRNSWLTGKTK